MLEPLFSLKIIYLTPHSWDFCLYVNTMEVKGFKCAVAMTLTKNTFFLKNNISYNQCPYDAQ